MARPGFASAVFWTRDEIQDWTKMTDYQRHQILGEKPQRQAKVAYEVQTIRWKLKN
jgi:predicted Fe-S protein YdhL (DUF1289 family)